MLCSSRDSYVGEQDATIPSNHPSSGSTDGEDYVEHTCPGAGVSFQEPDSTNKDEEDNKVVVHTEFIVDHKWY